MMLKKNYDIYSTYNILKGNNDYTLSQNLHTCTEAGGFFFQPRVNLDILLAKWLSNICTCNQSIKHWLKYFNSQEGARYIYYYSIAATYCGHWSNEHHFNFLRGCRFGLGWVQKIVPYFSHNYGAFQLIISPFACSFFIAPLSASCNQTLKDETLYGT